MRLRFIALQVVRGRFLFIAEQDSLAWTHHVFMKFPDGEFPVWVVSSFDDYR